MMPTLLKGDRLVVSKYPYGWSWVSPSFHIFPHWQGRLLGKMPRARRHRHRHSAGPERRLHQAGDRPSRRHDRGPQRPAGHQRQAREGGAAAAGDGPGRRQRPVRHRILGLPGDRGSTGRPIAACRSSARRFPTASPTTRSTSERERRATIRAGHRAGRPCLPDGRQPRSQRRQPLRSRPAGERPRRTGAVGEYRRPRGVHHLLARRHVARCFNPVSWFQRASLGPRGRLASGTEGLGNGFRAADRRIARRASRPRRIPRSRGRPRAEARGGLVRARPPHRRRDRPRAAAAADHWRNDLRRLPRRRRAPASAGSCRSAAASGSPWR